MALLVLGLGLPRVMVVCEGPHCDGRIEFVHAAGECCGHDHAGDVPAPAGEGGPVASADRCGCVDLALGCEPGPLPKAAKVASAASGPRDDAAALAPLVARPEPFAAQPPRTGPPRAGPPRTGPPRVDARIALRSCTVLLV